MKGDDSIQISDSEWIRQNPDRWCRLRRPGPRETGYHDMPEFDLRAMVVVRVSRGRQMWSSHAVLVSRDADITDTEVNACLADELWDKVIYPRLLDRAYRRADERRRLEDQS